MITISRLLDISRPDALLDVAEAPPQRMWLPHEERDEWMHTCRGEKHGGIILGYQRLTRDLRVILGFKKCDV